MKNNIEQFDISHLRNEEWFQFHSEFITLVQTFSPAAMGIHGLFPAHLALFNKADTMLEQLVKSLFTDKIKEADDLRDTTFRSFKATVKAFESHIEPTKKEAAKTLMIVFKKYGDIAKKSYNAETASIYNLLQDLHLTYQSEVNLLALTEWVQNLEAINQIFETLLNQRYDEQSGKPDMKLLEIRKSLDESYANLVKYIEAHLLLHPVEDGTENLDTFVNKLNVIIKYYKNLLAQRHGRAKAKKNEKD
jgi:hypothetical protein